MKDFEVNIVQHVEFLRDNDYSTIIAGMTGTWNETMLVTGHK